MRVWLSLAILCLSAEAMAEPTVVVRPHTEISQTRPVLLSDVADLSEVDGVLAKKLGALKLAEGPKLGEKIEFTGAGLSSILRSVASIQTSKVKPTFTIPSKVTVQNVGNQATEAQIRLELARKWELACGCRVQLDELIMPKIATWVSGSEWQLNIRNEMARGTFNVPLEIRHEDQVKIYWIRGRVSYFKNVPVAKRGLSAGDRIQPNDFEFSERDVTFARDSVMKKEEMIGRRLKQSVAAEDIIFSGHVEREKALKRGDQVKIALGESDWEVSILGVVEQDGNVGDTVKVRNVKSNQVVIATVVGPGEVRVQ